LTCFKVDISNCYHILLSLVGEDTGEGAHFNNRILDNQA